MTAPPSPAVPRTASPVTAAMAGRCPHCGRGRLFAGFLNVRPTCDVCGIDLSQHDNGDGPAVFVILLLGFLVVGLALVVEVRYAPPLWLHAALWFPLILGGSIGLLRPLKGWLVAQQYKHRRGLG